MRGLFALWVYVVVFGFGGFGGSFRCGLLVVDRFTLVYLLVVGWCLCSYLVWDLAMLVYLLIVLLFL